MSAVRIFRRFKELLDVNWSSITDGALLKRNGANITLAVAGTDYLAPADNGSGLTGITQSQVAGLTTASSPTFAGLTVSGGSFARFASGCALGTSTQTLGSFNSNALNLSASQSVLWSSHATFDAYWQGAVTGIGPNGSGSIQVNNGTAGKLGNLTAGTLTLSALATPAAPTVAVVGTAGSTTYTYKIVAKQADGTTTDAGPATSTATGNATLSGTNYNTVSWAAVTGATSYDVYRTAGGTNQGRIATGTTALTVNDQAPTVSVSGATTPTTNSTGSLNLGSAGFVSFGGTLYALTGTATYTALNSPNTFGQIQFLVTGAQKAKIDYTGVFFLGSGSDTGLARNASGVVEINNGTAGTFAALKASVLIPKSYTVATLPSASTSGAGSIAYVTDSSATLAAGLGTTVAGGGSNKTKVTSDGTNWIIG